MITMAGRCCMSFCEQSNCIQLVWRIDDTLAHVSMTCIINDSLSAAMPALQGLVHLGVATSGSKVGRPYGHTHHAAGLQVLLSLAVCVGDWGSLPASDGGILTLHRCQVTACSGILVGFWPAVQLAAGHGNTDPHLYRPLLRHSHHG
jgi:hypothetical protein